MKHGWVLLVVVAVACKGKDKDKPSVAGSASAITVVVDAAPAVDAAPVVPATTNGVLQTGHTEDPLLVLAYGTQVPVLPAVSHDGKWIATWHSDGGGPMPVPPLALAIEPLDGAGKREELELLTFDEVSPLETDLDNAPLPPALEKLVKDRGAAVRKRLEGFESLVSFDPAKGSFKSETLEGDDEAVTVTLTTQAGKRVRRIRIEPYGVGRGEEQCNFRPTPPDLYENQSQTRVYGIVMFRFRDECGMPAPQYFVWELAGEDPDPTAELAKDAVVIAVGTITPARAKLEGDGQHDVGTSADGKSAWASFIAKDGSRASSVLAAQPDGTWRVIAMTSTKAVANSVANANAKSGKLKEPAAFADPPGDEGLRAAFAQLTTDGMKSPAEKLVAFGSGPGERTTTGAALAKGWNAGWKGKVTIVSSVARLAPSGTTGWVAANVMLAKPTYKIPFHIFAVFDKARSGAWTLVHLHFSVPPA